MCASAVIFKNSCFIMISVSHNWLKLIFSQQVQGLISGLTESHKRNK